MSTAARAWTSLLLPPFAWYLFQQGIAHVVHVRCDAAGAVGGGWGVASLLACAFAARIAWPLRRPELVSANPWLCRVALLGAGVFALAIAFQTLAVLLVPACVR
jgi:hypothetical protein